MKYIFIMMLILSLVGCGDRQVQGIDVMTNLPVEQESLRLKEKPGVAPAEEGRLIQTEAGLQSPQYTFHYSKDFPVPSTGLALRIEYRAAIDLQLQLDFDTAAPLSAELPGAAGKPVVVVLPLGSALPQSVRILPAEGRAAADSPVAVPPTVDSAPDQQPAAGLFQLEALALEQLSPPVEDVTGFELSLSPRQSTPPGETTLYQYRYRLDYRYRRELLPAAASGAADDRTADEVLEEVVPLRFSSGGNSAAYRLFAKEGKHSIYFYSRNFDFQPEDITVESGLPGFEVTQVSYQPVPMFAKDSPAPIPADMGTILRYERQAWRRSDWELFSWNLFPSILVFDFRDYNLQAAFLKRLAFFVEKKWSTGKLLSNSVLEPLHGWNAHDYRAQDLAAFFQKAQAENFPLNPEEELLRRILLEQGIIRRVEGNFLPGEGGFLSLARESSDRLRYIFATHEGYHGLYFASLEYRRSVSKVWERLSDDEKRFWELFLDWKSYNTGDPYLMENEFQAYLMQQHRSYVDTYFKDYIIPRFISLYPEYAPQSEYFLKEFPDHFSRSAELIETAAQRLVGISAGDLVCIRESEHATAKK